MSGPRDASGGRDQHAAGGRGNPSGLSGLRRSGGGSAGPTTSSERAAAAGNVLRIPTELQPHEHPDLAFRRGSLNNLSGDRGDDGMGGMVSPLPFESSLAPDFLALFANNFVGEDTF